jgi:3'-phosphoadenosine 5'-phosphosulfate sulfotransferase (PAPS reductase)/FAD synthetase
MDDPFHITGPALISFSGGRTSGYMLWRILQAHGGTLPDDVHVTFANTGKEREETLRFVHECGTRWGVRVRWLEWRSRKGEIAERFEEVGFNSASRAGEPFTALIRDKSYLPNSVMRFCTIELKIRVMDWFMKSQGFKNWTNVVGLRADEPSRVKRARGPQRSAWVNALPLDDAGVTNRDVRAFWREQDFDLGLLPFEGNCDGCFLKARPKLIETERTAPGTLQWWAEAEALATSITNKPSGARFRPEYTYAELIRAARNQGDLFLGAFDNDPDMDAECGTWCGEAA